MKNIFFPTANGVMCQKEDVSVLSLVKCDGSKKLISQKTKNKIIFWHFPFVRGLQFYFCGLYALLKTLLVAEKICDKQRTSNKKIDAALYILSSVIGIIVAAILIGLVPGKLGYLIVGKTGSTFLRNFIIAFFKIIMLALLFASLKLFPVMREFFRFNRACDIVSIYGENWRSKTKNGLCEPLNFLNFFVFISFLSIFVITLIGISVNFILNLFFNIAIFLLCIMLGYELLNLIDRSKLSHLKSLCFVTASFVCLTPSITHIEVALSAQMEMNLMTTQTDRTFITEGNNIPFSVVYTEVRNKLLSAKITDKSDADWIIATVLGKNRAEVKLVEYVSEKEYKEILKATKRRMNGESVDNIFGFTEFYGLRFDVNKNVLTPRMDTEILVEHVINSTYPKARVLDIGTGSGAIAIAVAKKTKALVTAVDISKSALITAQNNAKKNDVKIEFVNSNLFENLKRKKKFDIIVSNPPYIPSAEIEKLDANVRQCDPKLALDGGEDGLDFYRAISKGAKEHLCKGGLIFYEVGKGQAPAVKKILKDNGFTEIKVFKDYNKIERVVCGKYV